MRPQAGKIVAAAVGASLVTALCGNAAAIQPAQVVLLYNSTNSESLAVANAYIAARPGVVPFDLADPTVVVGTITRANYVVKIRNRLRSFINGDPPWIDRSGTIAAIVTTRGLPGRVESPIGNPDEFLLLSSWASLESELVLLQQDLEVSSSGYLSHRYAGFVANPYHRALNVPVNSFSRAGVRTPRAFTQVSITGATGGERFWRAEGLTPGDMYFVCRLDSDPGPGNRTNVQNIQSLITRSLDLRLDRCAVQALLDEYAAPPPPTGFELDDEGVPPLITDSPDFENAAKFLAALSLPVRHDETFDFVTGPELADQTRPLMTLGTYGENHPINNWGENPPGTASYLLTYTFHPASFFIAYESFNGTSIWAPGFGRGGQQQALPFIALGGSFTIVHVMEPFAFSVADLQWLLPNMLLHGLTYAEAAYSAIPALSWQSTPIGDPLARVMLMGGSAPADLSGDGKIGAEDLYFFEAAPVDADCDGMITSADRAAFRSLVRAAEMTDLLER